METNIRHHQHQNVNKSDSKKDYIADTIEIKQITTIYSAGWSAQSNLGDQQIPGQ